MAISPTSSSAASTLGSAFNVDGIVSGLKTADIIAQLMTLAKAPLNQLTAQQAAVQTRDDAYKAISSQMIIFQGSAQNLLLTTGVNTKLATTLVPTVATATANSTAINGSFSVNVANLATATAVTSNLALGTAADLSGATVVTSGANMAIMPTAGTFTINGQSISIASTDTWTDVKNNISTATSGAVQLVLPTDPGGVPNSVSLSSTTPVQLGAPTDSSNFLSATQLLTAPQTGSAGAYKVASNQLLGEAKADSSLSSSGIGGLAVGGAFKINGVSISWTNADSLNGVLTRINASSAGVTATYDPKLDKVNLTNTATGAQNISLVEDNTAGGALLHALNLTGATQTFGAPAQYTTTQNGVTSAIQFSNSNTVNNVVQGVSVTLLGTGTTNVNIAQDTTTATKNLQAFVTQFNTMVDLLDKDTAYDATTNTAGVLAGDSSITGLASQLRSQVAQAAVVPAGSAYRTLGDIGISTGAYGSAVGTTNHLVLDTDKLTAALQNNPQAVTQLLSGLTGTTTSTSSASSPWIANVTGTPYNQVNSGTYKVTFNPIGNTLTSVFTSSNGTIQPAVTSTITAGGTNSALIPGMSIIGLNPLPTSAGTDTINYNVTGRGILQSLNDYITKARGPNGIFASESTNANSSMASFTAQIANQNQLLAQRQATLQAQFTAMEVALSQLQSQGASLSSSIASMTPTTTNK
jgi:flagellar hook-associated protein 2